VSAGNHSFAFEIDPFRKDCLMGGLDDIGLTMQKLDNIATFEIHQKTLTPWLYAS
jgi:3-isopropylmalate/(R)-2-methylmalate dehydratase small subunit